MSIRVLGMGNFGFWVKNTIIFDFTILRKLGSWILLIFPKKVNFPAKRLFRGQMQVVESIFWSEIKFYFFLCFNTFKMAFLHLRYQPQIKSYKSKRILDFLDFQDFRVRRLSTHHSFVSANLENPKKSNVCLLF